MATQAAEPTLTRIGIAEFVGTLVLMIVGPGTAIFAVDAVGAFGVALSFGAALLIMAYAIGHISGCHINPAVTLGFVVTGKLSIAKALYYWVAQAAGAIAGGLILFIATSGGKEGLDKTGVFASNGWGDTLGTPYGLGAVVVVEIVFTALLIFVVLSTTTKGFPAGFGGLAAGVTLMGIHLATIPVDNTSVNPARSLGAAIFGGGDHLAQLWAFIVFPLIGALVGAAVWAAVHAGKLGVES